MAIFSIYYNLSQDGINRNANKLIIFYKFMNVNSLALIMMRIKTIYCIQTVCILLILSVQSIPVISISWGYWTNWTYIF